MDVPRVPPWQLAIRFGLEVGALVALGQGVGRWAGDGIVGWVGALGAPAIAAAAWVTFAVRNDPSRSGRAPVPVPGWARLALELIIFLGGALCLARLGHWVAFAVFVGAMVVHHGGTVPRLRWLVQQR